MIDITKTFKDLVKGDIIYEVDLSGNINQHQLTSVEYNGKYLSINWDSNCGYGIPNDHIASYGYASFFTVYHRAVKLSNSRKKHTLKVQIEHYKKQITEFEKKIRKAKIKLQRIEEDMNLI